MRMKNTMQRRQWMTVGLSLTWVTLVALAVASVSGWLGWWRSILTGANLVSPLGCDCGVDISFWQHPFIYGLGLGITALLVGVSVWLSVSLVVSWKKTFFTISRFSPLVTPPAILHLWFDLHSQIFPRWWPRLFLPQLHIFQDQQPRAMSAGLIQPTVFCSSGALAQLSTSEVRAMLAHELMHIKSFDPVLLWFIRSWTSVLPRELKQAIQIRLTEYIECQTDWEASQLVGVASLGHALLSVAAWEQTPALSAAAHLEGVVETRLQVLAGWLRSPSFPWKPAAVAGIWLACVVVSAAALLLQVNRAYAKELRTPACLEAQSIVVIDHEIVLICPYSPMSVL